MLWQNASARTVRDGEPAGSRSQRRSSRVRIVVAPSRCLQNAAKSCSPSSAAAAAFISARSSGRGQASTWRAGSGSTPSGRRPPGRRSAATTRRTARRSPSGAVDRPLHAHVVRQHAVEPRAASRSRPLGQRVEVGVHDLAARMDARVGAPGAGQLDTAGPAAPWPARPRARPRPSAAPAARPSRGSRCRRRRRRGGSAPPHPLGPVFRTPRIWRRARPAIMLVSAEHGDFLLDEFGRYAARLRPAHRRPTAPRRSTVAEEIRPSRRHGGAVRHRLRAAGRPRPGGVQPVAQRRPDRRNGSIDGALGPLPRRRRRSCGTAWPRASTTPTC